MFKESFNQYHPCMVFTCIYHILPLKTTIHVGKYTIPMDAMGNAYNKITSKNQDEWHSVIPWTFNQSVWARPTNAGKDTNGTFHVLQRTNMNSICKNSLDVYLDLRIFDAWKKAKKIVVKNCNFQKNTLNKSKFNIAPEHLPSQSESTVVLWTYLDC